MLIIWCAADPAVIRKTIGPIVGRQSIQHRVEPDVSKIPHREPGDVLLAFGAKALDALVKAGMAPKNRTVTSLGDRALPGSADSVFVTFDPTIVSKDYARLPDIQWAVQLAIRKHETGTIRPVIGEYEYVDSLHELIEEIDKRHSKTGKKVPVAADLECLGLDEYAPGAYIIACSFTLDEGTAKVLYFERGEVPEQPPADQDILECDYWQGLWLQLQWMFQSEKIALRGANFKFDCRWIYRHWGIEVTNLTLDTVLVGSLLDENRSNSLKLHAKVYTPLGGYEDDMKSKYNMGRLDLVPKQELLPYVGGDTDVTQRVGNLFRAELLKDRQLINFYTRILSPSSKVFEKMERTGVVVDIPYYHSLKATLETEIFLVQQEMLSLMPRRLSIKHKDKIAAQLQSDKNPLTPEILKDYLFTPMGLNLKPQMFTAKTGEPSTSRDHLMMFEGVPQAAKFVELMQELNSASKTLNTFVVGFLKHLRSDGRFHPSYRLARGGFDNSKEDEGTVTGRTSATDPAVQTLSKHTKWSKKLRRAYVAPPGKVIIQIDYSQGELKITACLAEEPVMIQAYLDGQDLHAITASQLNGYSMDEFMLLPDEVRDELRSGGKAGNFGLIYGMQALGFQAYAYTTYGVEMTESEAFSKREAFFALYQHLIPWHESSKQRAKLTGMARSPLGRIRHLPLINSPDRESRSKAERQAINSPVQSTLSDMMQLAMVNIDLEYGHTNDVEFAMMCHDACVFYVPEGDATLWAKRLKTIMDNLPLKEYFGWDHQLPFTTDAEVSVPGDDGVASFATLKKLKNL